MYTRKARRARGVTLVELVLFIVIVSIALAGVLGVLTFTTKNAADPLRRKQALLLAEALLEEVELADFTYCDPNSEGAELATSVAECKVPEKFGPEGESRPFNNVNDYAGSATPFNDASGKLVDVNGEDMGLAGYSASLQIVPENLGGIAGGTQDDPSVLRISITVTYDNGQSVRLDGYRARYAPQVQ
ncbi:type II secretion system GspH family protein [Massilia solisilvae]|uniref:Type II secretion system GspH family protein n=1 Tax=Massilia solisilvae TaxID=1811225 RepID=A0ABT2BMA6_9BURK|nr:type II secretion system protein [Massilia solisilvae]MCS0609647.1 type II secretion system GspH family protein [Massilia solisilvae]